MVFFFTNLKVGDHLAGLVVKASTSGVEDPGFESRLQRDFSRVELKLALQWLPCQVPGMIGLVLGLVGPVSVYCDVDSLICNFYLSVAASKIVSADPSLRYSSLLLGRPADNKQTNREGDIIYSLYLHKKY